MARRSGICMLVALSMVSLLLMLIADQSEAQVNFSPSWGKRANGGGAMTAGNVEGGGAACRSSMEALLYIYKLVQSEAQKLVGCSAAEKFAD